MYGLGWEEFINYTPAKFIIFIEKKQEIIKDINNIENLRFGLICATINNIFCKRKRKPSDFFKKPKSKKVMTAEEMAHVLKRVTKIMGGTIKE